MASISRIRVAASLLAVVAMLIAVPAARSNSTRSLLGVGYYVDFDPNSWTAVRTEAHRLSWVITTNYVLADATGRLAGADDPRIIALVRSRGSRVHFRVANLVADAYSAELAHAVLTMPAASLRAIAGILQVMRGQAYDGVVLDFQNVASRDRQALSRFVTDLAVQLHDHGRPLTVVVPAKAREATGTTTDAYDLAALGRAADWVIVRTYGEYRSAGPVGPIAPLPWVEQALAFTTARVPSSQVFLGIGLFGYDWPRDGTGESISMREALGRARRGGAPVQWDEQAETPYFTLFGRTVHFENAASIERKLSLASRYGLAGAAFWRMGSETPDVWSTASAFLRPLERAAASSTR